ncbi:MAG: BatD family protein [Gammaproteobacteria bacterium]|nr:BatD family protein [Gammaproteobacteria bacterium]
MILIKGLISFLLLLISMQSYAATITTHVDRNPVTMNESFQLTLKSEGSVDKDPDFSVLTTDFEILNQGNSSNISIVNGVYSKTHTWTLTLMPKRAGKLTIPTIHFGDDLSPPYELMVNEASKADTNSSNLYVEVDVSTKNAYVQGQIIYTIKLYSAFNLSRLGFSDLKITSVDTMIEPLGEQKQYQIQRNDQPYLVIEQNYALFPQQAGTMHIEPVEVEAQVMTRSNSFMNRFGRNSVTRRVSSEAIDITVNPVPGNISSRTWLPSTSVKLTEYWPDSIEFKVGDPITRTLVLAAEGLTAAQLPEFGTSKIQGLKQYPDQAKLEDSKTDQGISGQREEKIAYIPTQAGEYTLPAIEIPWWNTQSSKIELTRIPARTIQVTGVVTSSPHAQTDRTIPSQKDNQPVSHTENNSTESTLDTTTHSMDSLIDSSSSGFWFWLSLFLAAGWLSTIGFWWYKKPGARVSNTNEQHELSLKQATKNIKQACSNNDPQAVKTALLDWARLQFPEQAVTSLGTLARLVNKELQQELQALNTLLYSSADPGQYNWNGANLWQQFNQSLKGNAPSRIDVAKPALEPLYK